MQHSITPPSRISKHASLAILICALPGSVLSQTTDVSYGKNSTLITRTFDLSTGSVLEENADGVTQKYTYTPIGDTETITDARGFLTRFAQHAFGIALQETSPEGQPEQVTIHKEVNGSGAVITEWRNNLPAYEYDRDAMGRIAEIRFPKLGSSPETITCHLNSDGMEIRTSTRGPKIETRTYDGLGRMIKSEVGGVKRNYEYDIYGRLLYESAPYSSSEASFGYRYEYDALGRLTKRTHSQSGLARTFNYGNENDTPQVAIKNEKQQTSKEIYRSIWSPAHMEIISIEPGIASANIKIKRNIKGQPTEVSQNGVTRTYEYDAKFHPSKEVGPESAAILYTYDSNGNLTNKRTGSAFIMAMSYDGRNRPKSRIATRANTTSPSLTAYTHDALDRPTAIINMGQGGTLRNIYDDNGNIISEIINGISIHYKYNEEDALNAITYPLSRRTVTYQTDNLGRPISIGGYLNEITYSDTGHVASISYSNGVKVQYNQDARLRADGFSFVASNNGIILNKKYAMDDVNNITSITENSVGSSTTSFTYDAMSRLTSYQGSKMGQCIYVYTGHGDIASENCPGRGTSFYSPDGQRRLGSTSGINQSTFRYDEAGNMTAAFDKAYDYSNEAKLASVSIGGQPAASYAYLIGTGKRMSVVLQSNGQTTKISEFWGHHGNKLSHQVFRSNTGKTTNSDFIYLGNKLIAIWEN